MLALGKTKYDKRKEDWLVQKFGLRQLESLDAIQAEPPFLLITQEDNLVPRVLSYSAPVARKKGRWERGCQEEGRRLCSARLLVAYMTDAKKGGGREEKRETEKREGSISLSPNLSPFFFLFEVRNGGLIFWETIPTFPTPNRTFCLSWEVSRELKQRQRPRHQERQKSNRLRLAKQRL